MARIPDRELARIKRDTDLVALIRSAGVELKKHGRDWLGLCPHHDDHEPSLVVSPEKHLWHCLGACSTGGSAIDWVMRHERVGFRAAVDILRRRLGRTPATSAPTPPPPTVPPDERASLLEEVVSHYQRAFVGDVAAQEYASSRGITPEAVEHFRIGAADRTLGLALQDQGTDGREKRDQLKALGVLRERTGHEHLVGCLVIPVLGLAGPKGGDTRIVKEASIVAQDSVRPLRVADRAWRGCGRAPSDGLTSPVWGSHLRRRPSRLARAGLRI